MHFTRASDNEFSLGGQMPKNLLVEQYYVFSLYLVAMMFLKNRDIAYNEVLLFLHYAKDRARSQSRYNLFTFVQRLCKSSPAY